MVVHEQLSEREIEILRLIAEGASDREIAGRLYLSLNTVKWHNRQIYAKLGVSSRTRSLAAAADLGLLDDQPAPEARPVSRVPTNLPAQISSFVGREKEIEEIKELLGTHRLVTLTGPGGVGKTRLALEAAAQLGEEKVFSEGIYFVELAPVTKSERVGEAVVQALGLIAQAGQETTQQLIYFLEDKKLLLLIDNFEHLLGAAPLVGELLQGAPNLTILCTSREVLHISGEQVYQVPPLTLPDPGQTVSPSALVEYEAVDLFIRRAREVKSVFDPDSEGQSAVVEICTRLDGLPLAIELAAARVNLLSLPVLLEQLEDRFAVLYGAPRDAPGRHQSLRDAIDWSYQLLTDEEKILFYRLAVFQGSRTIDAVEQVCCQDLTLNVLDGLASLLSKSLLRQEEGTDGELRFYLLETIHEFARKGLIESGEAQEIHHRHAVFFTDLAEKSKNPNRDDLEDMHWMEWLQADHENLRAALEWSFDEGDHQLGLRMVGALDNFWWCQGHYSEGKSWIDLALNLIDQAPLEVQGDISLAKANFLYLHFDLDSANLMYKQALNLYLQQENQRKVGWTYLQMTNSTCGSQEKDAECRECIKNGLTIMLEIDDKRGIHSALTGLGVHEALSGNFVQARIAYEKALAHAREMREPICESLNLLNLGALDLREDHPQAAQHKLKDSLKIFKDTGFEEPYLITALISYLACVNVALRQLDQAVILYGAADAIYQRRGFKPIPDVVPIYKKYSDIARSDLTEDIYKTNWEIGQNLELKELIAFALEENDSP